jgi:uncharacterized membrane protein
MDTYIVLLRAAHIVGAATWVGSSLSFAFFIEPAAEHLGSSAAPFMAELVERRKFPIAIAITSVVAIVAGALLYWHDSSGLDGDWITTRTGTAFTVGATAAIVAWLVGFFILRPGIDRKGELAARAASDPAIEVELAQLGKRLRSASLVNAWLVILAALAMAVARYL